MKDTLKKISQLLDEAEEYNLTAEVIWSYGKHRAEGLSDEEAIASARANWDL
jgi:hypothetical protein